MSPRTKRKVKNPLTKVSRKQKNPAHISFAGVNPMVKKHWDRKLTLSENYARLGLMCSLRGKAGGIGNEFFSSEDSITANKEKIKNSWRNLAKAAEEPVEDVLKNVVVHNQDVTVVDAMKKGAVSVRLANGEEETLANNETDEECLSENEVHVNLKTVAIGRRPGHVKSNPVILPESSIRDQFIAMLEEEAAKKDQVIRQTSEQEIRVLVSLLKHYNTDFDKMARDQKLNKFQLSAGQLKRKFITLSNYFKLNLQF